MRRLVVFAFASLFLAMHAVHGAAQERIVFATDWLAQAEHGGFYQALAEGIYKKYGLDVTIRMGGPQVNGLQLLAARATRRRHGRRPAGSVRDRAGRAADDDRRHLPEESDGADRASGRGATGRLEGQADCPRRGRQHHVLALAEEASTDSRPPETSVRIFGAAVPRRSRAVAAGLRDVGAILDREGRHQAGGVPAGRPGLSALRRGAGGPARHAGQSAATHGSASCAHPRKAGRATSPTPRLATHSFARTIRK